MTIQVVILAAGMGTRLARPHPKPLTKLIDGRTIMQQQVDNLREAFGENLRLTIVVGYKMEQVMEHMPDASFVYNENYDQTNTSKSLLKALKSSGPGGVLWMNGDVVFDPKILKKIQPLMFDQRSFVTVNQLTVANEEVKYSVSPDGHIRGLSKVVPLNEAMGEAIGINYVSEFDKQEIIQNLESLNEQEYFEAAIEKAIQADNQNWIPASTESLFAVEIDFLEDLALANKSLKSQQSPAQ